MLSSFFPMLPYGNKKETQLLEIPGGHLKFTRRLWDIVRTYCFTRAELELACKFITPTKNVIF